MPQRKRKPPERWELALHQSHSYRAWAFVVWGLTFWMAMLSLVTGSQVIAQLMIALLLGGLAGWMLGLVMLGRAKDLRRKMTKGRR